MHSTCDPVSLSSNRVNLLFAVQNILYTFHTHLSEIYDHMIEANMMIPMSMSMSMSMSGISSDYIHVHALVMNMLVPACNGSISTSLATIMTTWWESNTNKSLLNNANFPYQEVLSHFDDYFISSSIGHLCDSYVIPDDQVLFEGTCRDVNFISSTQHKDHDHDHDHDHDSMPRYNFVCIENLCSESIESNSNPPTTLQLSGDMSALASMQATDVSQITTLKVLKLLADHNVKVIFSAVASKNIPSGILYHMSLLGLVLINGVSASKIHYIAKASGIVVLSDAESYLDLQDRKPLSSILGQLRGVERVSMGFGASDAMLRLHGLRNSESSQKRVRQIVIRGCGSPIVTGIYRRLLKRSIRVIQSFQMHNDVVYGLPGCGINEMNWSIVWEEISNILEGSSECLLKVRNGESLAPMQKLSLVICRLILRRYDANDALSEDKCSISMISGIDRIKSQMDVYTLQSIIQICASLSEAYLAVPELLVRNRGAMSSSQISHSEEKRVVLWWKKHTTSVNFGHIYQQNGCSLQSIKDNVFGAAIKLGLMYEGKNILSHR